MSSKQESIIYPPFKEYTKNDLEFNVFEPKGNLLYCFVGEKTEPNEFILDKSYTTLFDLKNLSDVQRFCYYPGTRNIYTFLGFKTKDLRSKAMKNKHVLSLIIDQVVSIYPLEEKDKKRPTRAKNQNDQLQIPTGNAVQLKLPPFNEYTKDDIKFTNFVPQSHLVYLFFSESQDPTPKAVNSQAESIYGITYCLDIQRFHYYPGTKNIYTFIGFVNQNVLLKSVKALNEVALNHSVYSYPYELPKQTAENSEKNADDNYIFIVPRFNPAKLPKFNPYSKNDLEFKNFRPKKNLHYLFFAEQMEPTKQILNSTYKTVYSVKDASDIQRFCYYPSTNNIYTFIGFDNVAKRNHRIQFNKIRKYTVDGQILAFPIRERRPFWINNKYTYYNRKFETNKASNLNEKSDTKKVSNLNEKSDTNKVPNLNEKTDTNKVPNLNEKDDVNDNDNDSKERFFEEEIGIHYLCFKEKNSDVRNVRLENTKLFGIDNIKVLQRGVRFPDSDDPDYYTFLGFDDTKERTSALVVVQKLTDLIDIKSLQEINEFEYDYDDDDDEDDDGAVKNDDGNEYDVFDDEVDDEDDDFDDNENDNEND